MNTSTKIQFRYFRLKTVLLFYFIIVSSNSYSQLQGRIINDSLVNVHGMVKSEDGNFIPGVSVSTLKTQKGTITDSKGEFYLSEIPKSAIIRLSSIGYISREISIESIVHSPIITLQIQVKSFDETVVVAYGTTNRRVSTSNFGVVNSKEIERQPINNPLLALQGRVPGLVVEQNNGLPGGGIKVRVQGQSSLAMGSDPLIVIDGVPYNSQLLPTTTSTLGSSGNTSPTQAGSGNSLTYINSADIESITILKDADATSIYGSRAAAGAILITTKKGKSGPTLFNIRAQKGWSNVPRKMKVMNREQYLEMRHEALINDNQSASSTDYDLNGGWDTTMNTDWQKLLLGKTANFTDIQVSVSGGKEYTQFLVSGGYHKETTVFPGNANDTKGSLHFSINHLSDNQKFKLQLVGSYLVGNNQIIPRDLTNDAIRLAPVAPKLFLDDGSINWQPMNNSSTFSNPMAQILYYKNIMKGNNLIGSGSIGYIIMPGLEFKSSFGYNELRTEDFFSNTLDAFAPEIRFVFSRSSTIANGYIRNWIVEPQLLFNRKIGKGNLSVLAATTVQKNITNQSKIYGYGYTSDLVLQDIKAAPNLVVFGSINNVYKYNAVFGRLNYNWKEKYIINVSARRDGSSRFGSANRFNNFASAGWAWVFSNEDFFKTNFSLLNFGKLRGSYGTSGNDQIGDYQYLSRFRFVNYPVAYQGQNGLVPVGLPNPNLQWEETRKLTIGLDLGFLKDRILVFGNYYRNRSSNQLINYKLPNLTGFSGVLRNFPARIQNSGWEFTLTTNNINSSDFHWISNFNLNVSRNKLLEFPNLASSSYASFYLIGKSINLVKLYDYAGVNQSTGEYQFKDSHGNLTNQPDYLSDQTVVLETYPTFTGGLQNSLTFKGMQLDVFLQFSIQKYANNIYAGISPGAFSRGLGNQPISVLNRWQKDGDNKPIQRFSSTFPGSLANSYYLALGSQLSYSNASYIRVKNVSLSYDLPTYLVKKINIRECNIFVQGQNLLTFTSYKGLDPETLSAFSLPPLRTITVGTKITL